MENLNQIIEGLQSEMVETLTRWIQVPSVKGDPQPGAPFGADVRRALDMALADAKAMGFDVRNFDGYAGDVRMGPQGVNPLAILAHLDVVPAGDGWRTDPFGAEIRDGRMYGRGTNDDKGPAVAALYAMYALKKAGVPLKREVRLILGCDEESGWGCMHYYTAHCDMPKVGFSPDASFPVINTEKGLLQLELHGGYDPDGMVREIAVGERCNVVPGTASVTLTGDAATASKAEAAAREHGYSLQATCHE
ncbi:MAG: Sapep family Mn(2+)-dependent dipeptidase, partial [Candidatus Limiplasma sp.]|nr:Sapep family Mn(2+)-dependent dipeptidase [Candidatus Limiplasma sp.]